MSFGDVFIKVANTTTNKIAVFGKALDSREKTLTYPALTGGVFELTSDGLEGFSQASNSIDVVDYAGNAGGFATTVHAASTERTFTAHWKGTGRIGDNEGVRAALFSLFAGGDELQFTVSRWGVNRHATGFVRTVKVSGGNIYEEPSITVTVSFPGPYWRGDNISASAASIQADKTLACTFPSNIASDIHDIGFVLEINALSQVNTGAYVYINGTAAKDTANLRIMGTSTVVGSTTIDTTGGFLKLGGFSLNSSGLTKHKLDTLWANNVVGVRFYDGTSVVEPTSVTLRAYAVPLFIGV